MGHSLQYLAEGGQSSGISNRAATVVSLVWISLLLLKLIGSSINKAAICQVAGGLFGATYSEPSVKCGELFADF